MKCLFFSQIVCQRVSFICNSKVSQILSMIIFCRTARLRYEFFLYLVPRYIVWLWIFTGCILLHICAIFFLFTNMNWFPIKWNLIHLTATLRYLSFTLKHSTKRWLIVSMSLLHTGLRANLFRFVTEKFILWRIWIFF